MSGSGRVYGGGKGVFLSPGHTSSVPPIEEHQLPNNSDEVLRFVCLIPIVEGRDH